jgi:predicted nucleic acid-binding protein
VLDDKEARAMAEAMGVQYVGTAGVLLTAFVKGYHTHDELATAVRDVGMVLWLTPNVVAENLRRAREVER